MTTRHADTLPTDKSILRRLTLNDDQAANELNHRYARRISALARARLSNSLLGRSDEDDVVQSVFRVVFEKAREGALYIPDGNTLWELLAVVTLNKVRTLRAHHTASCRDTRSTVSWQDSEIPVGLCIDHDQIALAVRDVLQSLPNEFVEIIEMRLQGHNVDDIATKTGRSLRSTERVLQACREHLKSFFAPKPS